MKKIIKLSVIVVVAALSGCMMTPQQATKLSVNLPAYELCKRYYYTASINRFELSKAYGDVAVSRGINCEVYLAAIQNERAVDSANAAAIFGASIGLLGASQPNTTYIAPQQSPSTRCRVIRNPYGDQVYCN
jgi:hypothetical protein